MRCFLIIFDLVIAACFILGALLTRVLLPSAKNVHRHLGILHAWRVKICISPVDWRHRHRYCCWLGKFSKMWILKQYLWFLHAWQRTGVGKMYTASPTDKQTLWATDMIGCFSQEAFFGKLYQFTCILSPNCKGSWLCKPGQSCLRVKGHEHDSLAAQATISITLINSFGCMCDLTMFVELSTVY